VLLTRKLPAAVLARLEEAANVDRFDGDDNISHRELVERVAGRQGLISMLVDRVDGAVIDAGRDLKVVANVAVGYNNIDVAAARERGIVVTNTPDVLTNASADFAFALILAVTRRIGEGERIVRRGAWKRWAFDFLLGSELRGKQLGIVGYGRIGQAVATRAAAFGMRIAYVARPSHGDRPSRIEDSTGRVLSGHPGPPDDAEAMPLDRLLATSDVVSLHVPLTPGTRHLIDQPALARMRRTAYLINTARGPVVDEAALAWALKNHLIAGAALDVYEEEPTVHPDLLGLENIVLAPHIASATTETRTAMADLAVRNVLAVLSGHPAITPVA
jgi:glyoxylate reductase